MNQKSALRKSDLLCSDCGHHIHRPDKCLWTFGAGQNKRACECATEPAELLVNDMRSSALLVFLSYREEARRLRPGKAEVDAAYLDALEEVRNYARGLVEPERVAS